MDIFTQNKIIARTLIVVAVVNFLILGIILWKDIRPQAPPPIQGEEHKDLSLVLKSELNLSDSQAQQINKLRSDFFSKENDLATTIRSQRDSMNQTMFNKKVDEDLLRALARRIAENEYKMEILRIEQALEFKSICSPEQLEKYEGLVREIRDYFRPEHK